MFLGRGFGRILRIKLDIRLRVVVELADLAPKQAALGIEILYGQCQAIDHRCAVDVEAARGIVNSCDLDVVGRVKIGNEPRARRGDRSGRCGSKKLPTIYACFVYACCHGTPPAVSGFDGWMDCARCAASACAAKATVRS